MFIDTTFCTYCRQRILLTEPFFIRIKPWNGQSNDAPLEYEHYHEHCAKHLSLIIQKVN